MWRVPQGFGGPCCARILTSWFATKERGTYWGMWNIAHNLGGFGAPLLAGTAARYYGWKWGAHCSAGHELLPALQAGFPPCLMRGFQACKHGTLLPPVSKKQATRGDESTHAKDHVSQ